VSSETTPTTPVSLAEILSRPDQPRIAWSTASRDLNANLVALSEGELIPAHRNDAVDVFIVCIFGTGELLVDGNLHIIGPTSALLIPRGAERRIRALTRRFAYVSCHRRRAELWPEPRPQAVEPDQHD